MRRLRKQTSTFALWLLLGAPQAEAAFSLDGSNCVTFSGTRPHRELAQCVVFTKGSHTLTVSLHGTAPNHVTQVTFSLDGAPPFQKLDTDIFPVITPTDVGMRIVDLNFDGHADLGLMVSMDPGGRFHYLLFDPQANRFVSSQFLGGLEQVRVDAKRQVVVSTRRRAGATEIETFAWANGKYRIVERTIRETRTKSCMRFEYTWTDGRKTSTESPCKSH